MEKQKIAAWALAAAALVLVAVCWLVLPNEIVTQLGTNGLRYRGKLPMLLVAGAIGTGFSLATVFGKPEKAQRNKCLTVSAVGVAALLVILIVNVIV